MESFVGLWTVRGSHPGLDAVVGGVVVHGPGNQGVPWVVSLAVGPRYFYVFFTTSGPECGCWLLEFGVYAV